jgi:hypothetical protein
MQTKKLYFVLFLTPAVLGCNSSNVDSTKPLLDSLQEKVASLEHEVEKLKIASMVRSFENVSYLTPGDTGYSTARFDLGVVLIQLADIKSYANGTKIQLVIGNTLASSITGLKANIEWGKVDEKGLPINESTKSKAVSFSETIRSGAWTNVSLVLDGVPANELGFVRVRDVSHTGVSLVR